MWFGDEARIGQKNKITRRWAKRGSRPSAPSDQRTASTYIFGAICPKEGKAVGLILPWCNTAMMDLHLAAISADVAPGRHAALLLDQAGWHLSAKLTVPDNITIVPLPPKSPELTWGKSGQGDSRLQCHDFLFSRGSLRSEVRAIRRDAARCRARSNSHTARVNRRGTNIPLAAGMAQAGETILNLGL